MNFKEDFSMLKTGIVYLDNCATTLKPNSMIDEVVNYYKNYSANAHRGDYDISRKVDEKYEGTRDKVAKFINAEKSDEVIFTSGTTESLNMIIKGFFTNYLKTGDEILTTKSEHASLILPWFEVVKKNGARISYVDLASDLSVTMENIKKKINKHTKVISLAHITNVIGDIRPIKEICNYAHKRGILVVVDGAQSVPHQKIDVQDLDLDFLAFSAHKMLGPTGVGVLYGKERYLSKLSPLIVGGGMNAFFDSLMNVEYKDLPEKLEAGTPNIAGVIAFSKAIDYLTMLGTQNVHKYEVDLKKYLVDKLSKLNHVIIYNKDIPNGIITFNVDGVPSKKVASYLNEKDICVRVGSHCAKTLSEVLGVKNTCRASLYFYNTKEDVDKLVEALSSDEIHDLV
ncbi:MAG: cysteine desulfurase [Bacilli bacterium]|nr:cysteine desulfurase [Bacilli bacterium]